MASKRKGAKARSQRKAKARSLAAKARLQRKAKARSLALKKGWKTRQAKIRSRAAKKGWETRRRKAIEEIANPIMHFEGPHGRPALTKDWDGMEDHRRLAEVAKEWYPNAKAVMWAFRAQFITDAPEESRWISIPFDSNFKQQLQNSQDQVLGAIEGIMSQSLKVVVPLQLSIIIKE